jgi:hypothetical protein
MVSPFVVPIAAFAMVAVLAIGVPIARAFARRLERGEPAKMSSDVVARLERMEQAIDSIAVEVERIAEGQRFTTKLLAQRAGETGDSIARSREPGR